MTMDLKSFSDPYHGYRDEGILKEKQEHSEITEDGVKEKISQFSKLDQTQLMAELAKQIGLQRDQGKMDTVLSTIERIKPFLNADQKQKLEAISSQLDIKNDE